MIPIIVFLIAVLFSFSACAWPKHGTTVGSASVPSLSSPLAIADGTDHAQIQVQTNTASGTLYYVVSTNCTPPSVVQIQAGHDQGGSTPSPGAAGNQAVSSTGKQNANPAGTIAAVGTYCAFFQQNTSGGDSTVAASPSFATPGAITLTTAGTTAWNTAQGGTYPAVLSNFVTWFQGCFTAKTNATLFHWFDSNAVQCSGGCSGKTGQDTSGAFYDTQLRPALQGLPNQNLLQKSAFGTLPATDPTGLSNSYQTNCNQARAIGTNTAGCSTTQPAAPSLIGVTYVNPSLTYETTADGSAAGLSLWGTIWHEITEDMGRVSGNFVSASPNLFDALSFTGAGVRSFTSGVSGRYLSHDLGTTNDISANTLDSSPSDTGADETGAVASWFNIGAPNTAATPVLIQDIRAMTVLGYGLTHSCRVTYGMTNLN